MPYTTKVCPFGPGKLIYINTPALRVGLSTLGATLYSVQVHHPDADTWTEVNQHYQEYDEALKDCSTYIGATVGRFAGRISNGTYKLSGKTYHAPQNAGKHTIHSGGNAFDKKQWSYTVINTDEDVGVRFTYLSKHMENGFPADLECTVYYHIYRKDASALHTDFDARIPRRSPADETIVNMFNHAYWNLNGFDMDSTNDVYKQPHKVWNHELRMPLCESVAVTDRNAIPDGTVAKVSGALDFRTKRRVGESITDIQALNRDPCGYDHPFLIAGWKPNMTNLLLNADVYSPLSKIRMTVSSTFPCIWVYTANWMKPQPTGKSGERFLQHGAICLEPQHLPDAVNQPNFPLPIVTKQRPYRERMVNKFTVQCDGKL